MPLVIRWPAVVPSGSVCDEVVISNDFLPTFREIAGARSSAERADGVSILPLLKDPDAGLDRETVYWHFPHYHGAGLGPQGAVREGRFKLIEWFGKSVYGDPGAFELYDLVEDPGEQENLADIAPEVTARLKGKLAVMPYAICKRAPRQRCGGRARGFTLIELLVVIAIIAVLYRAELNSKVWSAALCAALDDCAEIVGSPNLAMGQGH